MGTIDHEENWLLPKRAGNSNSGSKVIEIVFLAVLVFTILRSLIHIFTPDGGAGSIAGIDTSVVGGSNIVSVFAFWGLSQLLLGVVFLVVYLRYRNLIPLMYFLVLAEYSGRILIGVIKPLTTSHVPPGAYGDYIMVPLAIVMLIVSRMHLHMREL